MRFRLKTIPRNRGGEKARRTRDPESRLTQITVVQIRRAEHVAHDTDQIQ